VVRLVRLVQTQDAPTRQGRGPILAKTFQKSFQHFLVKYFSGKLGGLSGPSGHEA